MNNIEDTCFYGAANPGTPGQQAGVAIWKINPMKEGTRLGDEGVDYVDWDRKLVQEAELKGLIEHLIYPAKPDITSRLRWDR